MNVTTLSRRSGEIKEINAQEADSAAVDAAVAQAEAAQPALAALSPQQRAVVMDCVADCVEAHTETLAATADDETALGLPRLRGEVGRTASQFRLFGDVLRDGAYLQATIDESSAGQPDMRSVMQPLGVVAVFGASNFPLAFSVPGGDTASALAAGCSVVAKAHPAHPATSEMAASIVAEALAASGLPEGLLGLVHGVDAGRLLVGHPSVSAVGFTGSQRVGELLEREASQRTRPIPFYGELGSMNPAVVMPGLETEALRAFAEALVGSVTLGAGQFCTKPGIVFVPADAEPELAELLVDAFDGQCDFVMLTEDIAQRFARTLDGWSDDGLDLWRAGQATSAAFARTTLEALNGTASRLLEECFGPVTVVVSYQNTESLTAFLEAGDGTLAASVWGSDPETARAMVATLAAKAGRVVWNSFTTGVRVGWSTVHGGPRPATTAPLMTSVGASAIGRWLRPVCYQDMPAELLPEALLDSNPLTIPQRVNGKPTR